MITPSAMAIAIEGSSADRRGASIATYSIGHQLGVGAGGLAWGAAVDAVGFSSTYLLALVGPALILAVVLRSDRLAGNVRPATK
jgi:predicted MFS family arabinose efflux permease